MHRFILTFTLLSAAASAQTVTPTVLSNGGGYTQTPSGSIAWTFGEPVSASYFASMKYTTMGFHQPEAALGTLIKENENEKGFIVFPNAVSDLLNLDFKGLEATTYNLRMVDAAGRLIYNSDILITESETRYCIIMTKYAAGTYYLTLDNKSFNKTLQIIKTNN
jgi:hypothetical protein